jgi:hypothetical protein
VGIARVPVTDPPGIHLTEVLGADAPTQLDPAGIEPEPWQAVFVDSASRSPDERARKPQLAPRAFAGSAAPARVATWGGLLVRLGLTGARQNSSTSVGSGPRLVRRFTR